MDTFLTATGSLALVTALVNFLKYVLAKNWNGTLTQLVVWVSGVITIFLLKASDVASSITLTDELNLANAKGVTAVLAGLGLGSAAMLVNDIKKAIDGKDDAKKPPLIGTEAEKAA